MFLLTKLRSLRWSTRFGLCCTVRKFVLVAFGLYLLGLMGLACAKVGANDDKQEHGKQQPDGRGLCFWSFIKITLVVRLSIFFHFICWFG